MRRQGPSFIISLVMAPLLAAISLSGCGPEMVRPRASGEPLEARPKYALVVGQFDIKVQGVENDKIGMTRHQLVVGDDTHLFSSEIPATGRTFALWVLPGVLCFGRPTVGQDESGVVLGDASPCVEIMDSREAYNIGAIRWRVRLRDGKPVAKLELGTDRVTIEGSPVAQGVVLQPLTVQTSLDVKLVAKKYKTP